VSWLDKGAGETPRSQCLRRPPASPQPPGSALWAWWSRSRPIRFARWVPLQWRRRAVCHWRSRGPSGSSGGHFDVETVLSPWPLIPLKAHFVRNRAKVEIGLGRGKRQYDKREALAEADATREMARALAAAESW